MSAVDSCVRMNILRIALVFFSASYTGISTRPVAQEVRAANAADGVLLEEVNSQINSQIAALGHYGKKRVADGPDCSEINGPRCDPGQRCDLKQTPRKCVDAKGPNAYASGDVVQVKSDTDGNVVWKPATIDEEGNDDGTGYTISASQEEYNTNQIRVLMPGDTVEAPGESEVAGLRRATFLGLGDGEITLKWKDGDAGETKIAADKVKAVDYAIINQEVAKQDELKDKQKEAAEHPPHKTVRGDPLINGQHPDASVRQAMKDIDDSLANGDVDKNAASLEGKFAIGLEGVKKAVEEMNGDVQKNHQMAFKVKQKELETDKIVREAENEKTHQRRATAVEQEKALAKAKEVKSLQDDLRKAQQELEEERGLHK